MDLKDLLHWCLAVLSVNIMTDTQLVAVLAGLGHPCRLTLWRMLLESGGTGLSAGTIASRMAILPSSLSFHLRQMTQAGILVQRRCSRQIIYAVNHDIMAAVLEFLGNAVQPATEELNQPDHIVRDGQRQIPQLGTECDGIILGNLKEESECRGFGP